MAVVREVVTDVGARNRSPSSSSWAASIFNFVVPFRLGSFGWVGVRGLGSGLVSVVAGWRACEGEKENLKFERSESEFFSNFWRQTKLGIEIRFRR